MRSVRIAAAVMAATAIATLVTASSADASGGLRLRDTEDSSIPCRWGREGTIRMETVDFAFTSGSQVFLQATDGVQFIAIRTSQNLPYSCAPVAPRQTPKSWAND